MGTEDAIRSAIAQAVEGFAAYVGTLPAAASWAPLSPSGCSTPTHCDVDKIHVKARWLVRMLAWVRATLDDAEDMDVTDESICNWLRELQAVADAAEDVLDELPHEASRLGLMKKGGWAAGGSLTENDVDGKAQATAIELLARHGGELERRWTISPFHQVHHSRSATPLRELFAFLFRVEQRMEEIALRFIKIRKPMPAMELEYGKVEKHAETTPTRRATSSVVEEPRVVGRIEELATIKQFLLSSDAEESGGSDGIDDLPVMAIVGMGGLGKTTLAQLAYNDDEVKKHFQLKSWVCVSEDFDVVWLTKAMLKSLNEEVDDFSQLDTLHRKLLQILGGIERFLLVLDDVWEAENFNLSSWNLLTAPLRNTSTDTKIIITTRSRNISKILLRTFIYDLGFLTQEDSLDLFKQHAFQGRDPNLYPNLLAIAKEIARKCGGVPLVAKTLGGLLDTEDNEEEWNNILDSKVWNASINQENSIIPILRLSYQHLPVPLKRCFRYCSLFPKDYQFDRVRIICMWMAQDYIKANRRELAEDVGGRYIDDLLSRSIFQHSSASGKFQMHDLMHDLAICVSRDECCTEGDTSCLNPKHIQHFSFLAISDSSISNTLSEQDIFEPESFRSFICANEANVFSISSSKLLGSVCSRMEHLRVLDLGGIWLSNLPMSMTRLRHLRYLCINGYFETLPEFVGTLYHLQTLCLLTYFSLSELPAGISNLLNLRYLVGIHTCLQYPLGIGKLTDLQTMPGFNVGLKHNYAKLGELKDMNNIKGEFAIKGLHNLADVNEAKKACLDKKTKISSLCLEWDPRAASSSIDDEVLESLKPSPKLGSLSIWGFKAPSYPSWLGDSSFYKLGTIKLELCENWTSLPPLGQLPSLKSLSIWGARGVEYIGREFFYGGFAQLEELTLKYMDNWKSWCGAQKGECLKLKRLSIDSCLNLESLSLINVGAVDDISISSCPKLRCMSGHALQLSHFPCEKTIDIGGTYKVGYTSADFSPLPSEAVNEFFHICRLVVTRCASLTCLPWTELTTLAYLKISECPLLNAEQLPPTLQVLCIYGNPCETEPCSQHRHSQRLKQVQQSNKEGEERSLHLAFRNVHDASEAANFCYLEYAEIHTLEIEWDCCTSIASDVVDSVAEEVLGKLYHPPPHGSYCMGSPDKLVIRRYTGSRFAGSLWDLSLHSLSSVTLQQCSKCQILPPLSHLRSLKELYVEGPSSLENIVVDECLLNDDNVSEKVWQEAETRIAFPRLEKLEFHNMPVWKELLGTKEGDFPLLHKLILKHCPKLRALPPLPLGLKELELEACHELTSLSFFDCQLRAPSSFDSPHTQVMKSLTPHWRPSLSNCPKLAPSASEGRQPTLQHMSLTDCPLLITWCELHSGTLAHIPNIWLDGVQLSPKTRKGSIRFRIKRIRIAGLPMRVKPASEQCNSEYLHTFRSLEDFPTERFACKRDPNSVYPIKQALMPASTHSRR